MQRAAKAIEQRMEKLQEVDAVKEDRQINFHQSRNLELHNKFPIMADRFTLQADNKVLLNEVSFQMPLGKKLQFRVKWCWQKYFTPPYCYQCARFNNFTKSKNWILSSNELSIYKG